MPLSRLWELLARKYNNDISEPEQEELDRLLLEHQDALELNEILTRSGDLEVKKVTTVLDEAKSREWIARKMEEREVAHIPVEPEVVIPDPPSPPGRSLYQRLGFIWLAIFLAILGANAWLFFPAPTLTPLPATSNEVATSLSKTHVTLPDGTTVMLNRNSKIDYGKDFGVKNRVITLLGEAYFEVVKNASTPLVVKAYPVKVTALGTAFDVSAYLMDSTVEISLLSGSIEVSSTNDPGRTILMRPGEKAVFSRTGAMLRLERVNSDTTEIR